MEQSHAIALKGSDKMTEWKAQMVPYIGLILSNHCQLAGTGKLYSTGVRKNQSCSKNGMTSRKSRYETVSADSNIPKPRAARTTDPISRGRSSKLMVIGVPNHNIKPNSIVKAIIASTIGAPTADSGTISLGKYIFRNISELLTRLLPEALIEDANSVQGTIPEYTKTG